MKPAWLTQSLKNLNKLKDFYADEPFIRCVSLMDFQILCRRTHIDLLPEPCFAI